LEYGNSWHDLYALPIAYTVVSLVLNLRQMSPLQVFLANAFFIFTPYTIFYDHVYLAKDMWVAHRRELDDRRISCLAYYLATLTFTLSMPMLTISISLCIGYFILGWTWQTFLVTYLMTAFHLLVQIQVGRALMVFFRGERIFFFVNLALAFYNILFSGVLAGPSDTPKSLWFLFCLSFSFWASSGSSLNYIHYGNTVGTNQCASFLECVLFDRATVTTALGDAGLSNPFRALSILMASFVVAGVAELLLLQNRRTRLSTGRSRAIGQPKSKEIEAVGSC